MIYGEKDLLYHSLTSSITDEDIEEFLCKQDKYTNMNLYSSTNEEQYK